MIDSKADLSCKLVSNFVKRKTALVCLWPLLVGEKVDWQKLYSAPLCPGQGMLPDALFSVEMKMFVACALVRMSVPLTF